MISSSNKISRKEEVNELFEQLGQVLEERVEALLIGGAVMLEMGLKDATKDIDVVCRSEGDKERLLAAAKALGFEIVGPEKRHERLGIKRLAVKGGRNLDVFAGRISYDFSLSEDMWQRATRIRSFGSLVVRYASREDIFIMKLIANRPGDAPDCSNLVIAGLDYNAVYREIEAQYRKAGEAKEKIWINYIEEGIARLQDNDLTIPIGEKISLLASGYHEKI
jgi:hypothetical protein